ncbi:MAG TPA: ubiquinol oxidase subunit II [Candidatus Binatia bacterium]|nr:ubiquinol oxidase subunit II [Candidatus Binatia bacterium]
MQKRGIKKYRKVALCLLPVIAVIGLTAWYLSRHTIAIMEPAGQIGEKERNLMLFALLLAAIVVIPVYTMAILIVFKYRENNHSSKVIKYNPDWDHSRILETVWWGIPIVIITILSVVTWNSAHALDPFKPIDLNQKTMNIQVIALDWKWLFIYPGQHVAAVNLAEIPVNTPVDFYITSDTVMNSFWVPQLGGQIYAMPGMTTQMHLVANKPGSFNGWSANISGQGFADMTFTVKSVSNSQFADWISNAQHSPTPLTTATYNQLAKPTNGSPVKYYSEAQASIFNNVIMKYMEPAGSSSSDSSSMSAMNSYMMGMGN